MGLRELAGDVAVPPITTMQPSALRCQGLRVEVGARLLLDDVNLDVPRSGSVCIMGPSGSGKTTLLNCIAGLRTVDDGSILLGEHLVTGRSEGMRAAIRLRHVGMVFQFGELLPELTVLENISLPLRLQGRPDHASARRLLDALDLAERAGSFPVELSGGEVQRVAIARALVGNPTLLIADEPTGALDEHLSRVVCDLLIDGAAAIDAGLVVATHDPLVADRMDRVMRLRSGRLEEA